MPIFECAKCHQVSTFSCPSCQLDFCEIHFKVHNIENFNQLGSLIANLEEIQETLKTLGREEDAKIIAKSIVKCQQQKENHTKYET